MKPIVPILILGSFIYCLSLSGQAVVLGSDPAQQIKITTSSEYKPQYWNFTASGDKTINNIGLEGPIMDASRFLSQASLGADLATMQHVADIGFEAWIDEQQALPVNKCCRNSTSFIQKSLNGTCLMEVILKRWLTGQPGRFSITPGGKITWQHKTCCVNE
jgi:hypothetical protein